MMDEILRRLEVLELEVQVLRSQLQHPNGFQLSQIVEIIVGKKDDLGKRCIICSLMDKIATVQRVDNNNRPYGTTMIKRKTSIK